MNKNDQAAAQAPTTALVLALLFTTIGAAGLELRADDGSTTSGTGIEPLDTLQPFGSTKQQAILAQTDLSESDVTGYWDLVVQGLDPTLGYDPEISSASKVGSRTWDDVTGLVANDQDVTDRPSVLDFVNRSLNAHVGWFHGRVAWPSAASVPTDKSLIDFLPQAGWFTGLDRPLLSSLEHPLSTWVPSAGESFTATCNGETHDLFGEQPTFLARAAVAREHDEDAASEYGGFRNDRLFLIMAPDASCEGLTLAWSLRFAAEAKALTPAYADSTVPEECTLSYLQDVRCLTIGSYAYQQRLKIGVQNAAGAVLEEQDPIEIRNWYAPIYPMRWACTFVGGAACTLADVIDECVTDKIVAMPSPDSILACMGTTSSDTSHIALALENPDLEVFGLAPTFVASGDAFSLGSVMNTFVQPSAMLQMFGDDPGWTLSGLWHHSDLCSAALTPKTETSTATGYLGYHRTSSCDFDTGEKTTGHAMFEVDLSNVEQATLGFIHFFEVESFASEYDVMSVQARPKPDLVNGILNSDPWDSLAQWDSRDHTNHNWTAGWFNLSAYAGQVLQVRFSFDSVDHWANGYGGWHIDQVRVTLTKLQAASSGSTGGGGGGSGCDPCFYAM